MTAGFMRFLLAISIVLFVAALLAIVGLVKLDGLVRDLAMIVAGHVLAKFSGVYDFYFGSSDGSKVKTELMKPPLDLSGAELDDQGK